MDYDVFNGDADGIFSLIQLRKAEARSSELITGVKRDINLLDKLNVSSEDRLTVLDVSMDKNKDSLLKALELGAEVFYVDHHFAGDIPESAKLSALINEAPDICTSLLVNGHLKNQFPEWAIAGAFGDNLKKSALALAKTTSLDESQITQLENLGIYVNYNGYGSAIEDLIFHPKDLYQALYQFDSPFNFIAESSDFKHLEGAYLQDMSSVKNTEASEDKENIAVFILPNESWARRVSGVYGNDLANQYPDRAHAVLTEKGNGNYVVSVRAPLNNKQGAADLCMQFPSGGGRAAAAGINDLEKDQVEVFIKRLNETYP